MRPLHIEELKPSDPLLLGYIDSYKWISAEEPLSVRTIPNGRLDAWISLNGRFLWQQHSSGEFQLLPDAGFFPLTRMAHRVKTEKDFRCLSIKFFPHALTLPVMATLQPDKPLGFSSVFSKDACTLLLQQLRSNADVSKQRQWLDDFFLHELFRKGTPDPWMREALKALEKDTGTSSMQRIAEQNYVTIKTLERRFKKVFGLSPKLFADLLRLQHAAKKIRQHKQASLNHGDLTEALGYGYYDQSHFVKACKKITGLTPKELFTKLPGQVTDFVIE